MIEDDPLLIRIGSIYYASTAEATRVVRQLLASLGPTESIRHTNESFFFLLLDLLKRHPEATQKGFFHANGESMVRDMTLVNQKASNEAVCLFLGVVVQPLGTNECKQIKVSWTKCIRPENDTYYYRLKEAMRYVVQEIIEYYSNSYSHSQQQEVDTKTLSCEECGMTSFVHHFEVDYFKLLGVLAENYLHTIDLSQFPEDFDRCPETYWAIFRQEDSSFRDQWIQFFAEHARPRWLCLRCIDKRTNQ